jgi:hypothetical protein
MVEVGDYNEQVVENSENIVDLQKKQALKVSFATEDISLDAEAGDFAEHELLGWTRSGTEVNEVVFKGLKVFQIPDDSSTQLFDVKSPLTLAQINDIHRFGGVFGGISALDTTDGNNGFFAIFKTHEALNITDLQGVHPFADSHRRIIILFQHDGTHLKLSPYSTESNLDMTFNGADVVNALDYKGHTVTNTVPKIAFDGFFKYEVHVKDGLDSRLYLYINDVLVGNPEFSPTVNANPNQLELTSGTSPGTNRVSYIRKFGLSRNVESNEITLNKEEVEFNGGGIEVTLPNGTRDYYITLPKDLNLDIGHKLNISSHTKGSLFLEPAATAGIATLIDGYSSLEIEFLGRNNFNYINELKDGAVFGSTVESIEIESLRTGLISYGGLSLPVVDTTQVVVGHRVLRFVDKISGNVSIIDRDEITFDFTGSLNNPDDLGVVHFYEDIDGNIFGSNATDWSTPEQRRRYCYLGNADVNASQDGFVQANNPNVSAFGLLDTFGDYLAIGGSIKSAGGKCSPNATNALGLDIAGYTAVSWGRNFNNKELPHTPTSSDIVDADLHLGYKISDISLLFGASVKNIDPNQYQKLEDIALTAVPSDKFTIQRLYQYPGTTYNMVLYGSTIYDSLEQAIANASTERYNLHPSLVPSCFLAYIIVKEGITNLGDAIANDTAAILNYDGSRHPNTIGADTSPDKSLVAGGKILSKIDQTCTTIATILDFELGRDTLYGCEYDDANDTIKNTSQRDMVVNLTAQMGRTGGGNAIDLELYVEISDDDGVSWKTNDSIGIIKETKGDDSSSHSLSFRAPSGHMLRFGIIANTDPSPDTIGIFAKTSTRAITLPSAILTIN